MQAQFRHVVVASFVALALTSAETPAQKADDILAGHDDPATLSQMLQWSLHNQDLDALHARAEAIRNAAAGGTLSADGNLNDLVSGSETAPQPGGAETVAESITKERLRELSQLSEQLMPNQVLMMREALELAGNETADMEARENGLLNLQGMVSDIDNAKGAASTKP